MFSFNSKNFAELELRAINLQDREERYRGLFESAELSILIIKDDKVIAIGEKQEIPKNAIIFDLKGKYIYPSFIDIFCDYGLIIPKSEKKIGFGPQIESNTKGAYGWNQAIKSNVEAYKLFSHNNEQAEELKKKIKEEKIIIFGNSYSVNFNPLTDIKFNKEFLPFHSNAIKFTGFNNNNEIKMKLTIELVPPTASNSVPPTSITAFTKPHKIFR